jgi:hypothetical protein
MTIAEFFVSKCVIIVRNSITFFKQAYDDGEIINADGRVFEIVESDESVPDQLMAAYKVAKDDKGEHLPLPTGIIDFVACNIYAFKHTNIEFANANLEEIRSYFKGMMSDKNRNLIFMLLTLVLADLGDHIRQSQESKVNS